MFTFTTKVLNRWGFRFEADEVDGKFVYKTTDKDEIKALEDAGFKEATTKAKKKKDS